MMKVTALKLQSRNKSRVNVYLDGKFAFGLAKIEAARLRIGQELTDADVDRLQEVDAVEQAHERALRFLAVRPRAEAEVRQRLREHKIAPAVIDTVLDRLRGAGLVDDQAFASYWVENRNAFRPRSQRALRAELKRKGVNDDAVLGEALAVADDAAAAYALAAKRARRLAALPALEFRRKLGDLLARRGFSYETIQPVIEQVWNEVHAETPDE